MASNVWMYKGREVHAPSTADIPLLYRRGYPLSYIVQQALDSVSNWEAGATPTYTNNHTDLILLVVPIDGRKVIWAKHRGHKARQVQVSPFVRVEDSRLLTASFTLELAGTESNPWLVRAYPGEYTPPLPWQNSARDAVGGRAACIAFWQNHAYVHSEGVVEPFQARFAQAPEWFSGEVRVG